MFFSFSSSAKGQTKQTTPPIEALKLGKKKRESSKLNHYIISPRVIIKAIIKHVTLQILEVSRLVLSLLISTRIVSTI